MAQTPPPQARQVQMQPFRNNPPFTHPLRLRCRPFHGLGPTNEKVTNFCTLDTLFPKNPPSFTSKTPSFPTLGSEPSVSQAIQSATCCLPKIRTTTGCENVAKSVFKDFPHLERLESSVDVDNGGSQRVLEKVGFQREGVRLKKYFVLKGKVIDLVIFSLLSIDNIQQICRGMMNSGFWGVLAKILLGLLLTNGQLRWNSKI
ncbi:hypothetical protein LguiA_035834 [Lonicera macranthoides]